MSGIVASKEKHSVAQDDPRQHRSRGFPRVPPAGQAPHGEPPPPPGQEYSEQVMPPGSPVQQDLPPGSWQSAGAGPGYAPGGHWLLHDAPASGAVLAASGGAQRAPSSSAQHFVGSGKGKAWPSHAWKGSLGDSRHVVA